MESNNNGNLSILFVLNRRSGSSTFDYRAAISLYFKAFDHQISFFEIPSNCSPSQIRECVDEISADRVVAIGGDGTIKLVAEAIIKTTIPLCIIPAGSANGLAKELLIPADLSSALHVVIHGKMRRVHLVEVNKELCIHLSDIGLNAFMVKRFESLEHRGKWGYLKAAWSVFWNRYRMQIEMNVNGEKVKLHAFMIVLANATKYGTGALINPIGSLYDHKFEVVILRQISFVEVFKMWVTHRPYHPKMTRVYQTTSVQIKSRKPAHFQVDGEYLGKVNMLTASVITDALEVMVP